MNAYLFEQHGHEARTEEGASQKNRVPVKSKSRFIRFRAPDQDGYVLLTVSKLGEELLAKAGIANAESLLPLRDAELVESVAREAGGLDQAQVLEVLRSRDYKKRMGLYARLWEQFTKEA